MGATSPHIHVSCVIHLLRSNEGNAPLLGRGRDREESFHLVQKLWPLIIFKERYVLND